MFKPNTYKIFRSAIFSQRFAGKALIEARSNIIRVRRVVPVRSGNSVMSRASDNSLKENKINK